MENNWTKADTNPPKTEIYLVTICTDMPAFRGDTYVTLATYSKHVGWFTNQARVLAWQKLPEIYREQENK